MKSISKAIKSIEELINLKKESQPDYAILGAPFYFLQGSILLSYMENSMDVFGNVQPLEIEESEEENEEEVEQQNGEHSQESGNKGQEKE